VNSRWRRDNKGRIERKEKEKEVVEVEEKLICLCPWRRLPALGHFEKEVVVEGKYW